MNENKRMPRLWHPFQDCRGKTDSLLPGLLLLVALGFGGYVGWLHFVPYWNHRTMVNHVKNTAMLDAFDTLKLTEEKVAKSIQKKLKDLGIDFDPIRKKEHLDVARKSKLVFAVNLRYKQVIKVPGLEPKVQWYEIQFEGSE